MKYKTLGQTGLRISCIGFGGSIIGGYGWGKVKDKESIAAIHKALELGVNFFDTADVYGLGHSEEVLAKGLGYYRKRVVIATKVGVRWDKRKKESYKDLSPEHIREAVEGSLTRLKIDCIPLYQIHYPDYNTLPIETMAVLNELQREGKILYIGCSNFTPVLIKTFQKHIRLESAQERYNLLDHTIDKRLVPIYRKMKMSLLAYSPLAGGKLIKNKKLKEIALKYNKTPIQVAIRWILDNNIVTSAILGIRTPKEIEEDVGALGWKLSAEDRLIFNHFRGIIK